MIKINPNILIISLLCSFFISLIILFPNFVPFVDDWSVFEALTLKNQNLFNWIFIQTEGGHNFAIIKIILIMIFYLFNLNLEIFNYLSVITIYITALIFIRKLKNLNFKNEIAFWFIFFLFNGKFFPSISQMVNYSWLLTYMLIIIFWYNYSAKERSNLIILSTIFFAPLTLGFGLVIPLYLIIFTFFLFIEKKLKKIDLLYFVSSVLIIFVTYFLPKLYNYNLSFEYNYFSLIIFQSFLITYFSILGNIFVPWVPKLKIFVVFSSFLGFTQTLIILIFFIKYSIIDKHTTASKFIKENSLILLGLIFAGLVSITRSETLISLEARFFTGCLIFQLGFWLFIFKESKLLKLKVKIFKTISIYCFVLSFISPYLGIHWQISKSIQSTQIVDCYSNKNKNISDCHNFTYNKVFYNSDWYDIKKFNNSINFLYNEKKSFFSKIKK